MVCLRPSFVASTKRRGRRWKSGEAVRGSVVYSCIVMTLMYMTTREKEGLGRLCAICVMYIDAGRALIQAADRKAITDWVMAGAAMHGRASMHGYAS